MIVKKLAVFILLSLAITGCDKISQEKKPAMANPVFYFEIPVTDMDRAIVFYEELFGFKLDREIVDGYDMAQFPFAKDGAGATGALAKGDVYRPSKNGPIIYFHVDDIKATMAKAKKLGRPVLYPIKDAGAAGLVAEIEDSEGNRLALNQPR
jgi:uncharacterized protein